MVATPRRNCFWTGPTVNAFTQFRLDPRCHSVSKNPDSAVLVNRRSINRCFIAVKRRWSTDNKNSGKK